VTDLILGVVTLGIPFSVALLLASTGEMFNQKAGIYNLGCEGIMALGAFAGFLVPYALGPAWGNDAANLGGLAAALGVGALLGAAFALVTVTFRADQGIAGIGLQMLGVGLAGALHRHWIGGASGVPGIPVWPVPGLADLPVVGPLFFRLDPVAYLAFLLVPGAWWVLLRTDWGLRVRAVGDHPRAADSLGIPVNRVRYQALILGGMFAGLAGAYLSLCQAKLFADDLIAGRGFIAVALVYFGRWNPWGILGGALLFSVAQALQLAVQVRGIPFPYEFAVMLPYVLVIAVLAASKGGRGREPAELGRPFHRERRV